jgi:hypothetical protein
MTESKKPARRRAPDQKNVPQPAASRQGNPRKPNTAVSPTVARQIDENLKRLYNQHVEQDLPPDLQALIARLREGQTPTDQDDDEGSA